MKRVVGFMILFALVMLPLYPAYAQVSVDARIMEAAQDLDSDAQLEFLELIREPGEWEEVFENLGVTPDLADRIEERMGGWELGHKVDQAVAKMETIDDKIAHMLANVKDHQTGKAEKILEKALKKVDKVLAKVEKDVAKDKDKTPDSAPDPDPDDGKDKKDKGE